MLINFQVSNFKSIYEPATLSMLKGDSELLPHHVQKDGNLELLRFAAIYGANGAGKSNFLNAIFFLRTFILFEEYTNNSYTFINKDNEPVVFILDLAISERCFNYKLTIDIFSESQNIIEEINETLTDGTTIELYKFIPSEKIFTIPSKYLNSELDKSRLDVYANEILTSDASIITQFQKYQDPYEELSLIYNWFRDVWIFGEATGSLNLINTYSTRQNIIDLNNIFLELNTGIIDAEIEKVSIDDFDFEDYGLNYTDYHRKIFKERQSVIVRNSLIEVEIKDLKNPTVHYLIFKHNLFGEEHWLKQSDLSEGTRRLLTLIPVFERIRQSKSVVFFDEIERSIHPLLVRQLLTYLSKQTDFQGQIVFSTHLLDLLNSDLLRQDEIWFAEKNSNGSTELISLMEYDIDFLQNKKWSEAYQDGRFGAIPPKKIKQLAS